MSNTKRDYYDVLSVSKKATQNEIRSAYRKLALKLHPDRHAKKSKEEKDELSKQFSEINEAYQVLSDPEKRAKYDKFGHGGFEGFNFGGFDVSSVFQDIFGSNDFFESGNFGGGSGNPGGYTFGSDNNFRKFSFSSGGFPGFSGMGGQSTSRGHSRSGCKPEQEKPKPPPIFNITCTLDEVYNGTTKKLKIKRNTHKGVTEKVIQVDVRRGYKEGTKWNFKGEGDQLPNGTFQDITIMLVMKEDPFKRVNDDIEYTYTMDILDYLKDTPQKIKIPGNRVVTVKGSDFKKTGEKVRYPKLGMPNSKTQIFGDLLITFNLENKKLTGPVLNNIRNVL